MKKIYSFLIFALVLAVFACTIPSSIEVRGNPEVRFTANKDFDDMFTDLINDSFVSDDDTFKIINCSKTELQTFIIYMELAEEEVAINVVPPGNIGDNAGMGLVGWDIINLIPIDPSSIDTNYKLEEELELFGFSENEPFEIDLGGLGNFLEGFSFDDGPKGVKACLFVSGDQIVETVFVELDFGETYDNDPPYKAILGTSGFENWNKRDPYTGTAMPAGGIEIPIAKLLNNDEEIKIQYRAFMKEDTIIDLKWFDNRRDHYIRVELVIWLPLSFIADENIGADLKLPDDFMGGDQNNDLFGREGAGEDGSITDILDSINLVIQLNRNPFNGSTLIVESPNNQDPNNPLEISNPLKGTAFSFKINEADMKKLNSSVYYPFVPKFKLSFPPGGRLQIPRELRATSLYFRAKFHYTVDL